MPTIEGKLLTIRREHYQGGIIWMIWATSWKEDLEEKEGLTAIAEIIELFEDEGVPYRSHNRNTTIMGQDCSEGSPDRIVISEGTYETYRKFIEKRKDSLAG